MKERENNQNKNQEQQQNQRNQQDQNQRTQKETRKYAFVSYLKKCTAGQLPPCIFIVRLSCFSGNWGRFQQGCLDISRKNGDNVFCCIM